MGCAAQKSLSSGDAAQKQKWKDAEAKAKAEEEAEAQAKAAAATVEASEESPKPHPTNGEGMQEAEAPPPMRLQSLQEALVASLRLDVKQLKTIRKFWQALGLDDALPRQPLELTIDGDGSALELAITMSPEDLLSMIPVLLSLAPEAQPSPPGAQKEAPARPTPQMQQNIIFTAPPPEWHQTEPPTEAAPRAAHQLQPEVLLGMAPSDACAETLPTIVSAEGQRPRGKAKAKSRVIKEASTEASSSMDVPPSKAAATPIASGPEPLQPAPLEANPQAELVKTVPQRAEEPRQMNSDSPADMDVPAEGSVGLSAPRGSAAFVAASHAQVTPQLVHVAPNQCLAERLQTVVEEEEKPARSDVRGLNSNVAVAASQWRETLERAIKELGSSHVVAWLHLGGLGLPNGVARPTDVGVRLSAASRPNSFRIVQPYQDVFESLEEMCVTEEAGWVVGEMGCSFFAHGPLVNFTIGAAMQDQQQQKPRCDEILQKVVPSSLAKAAQVVAHSSSIEMSIRAGLTNGDLHLGARFELNEESRDKSSKKDLQSLAVDLALGKEKVFNAFLVERTRQMFASMGGNTVVTAIECRANDMALVTFSLSPDDSNGQVFV